MIVRLDSLYIDHIPVDVNVVLISVSQMCEVASETVVGKATSPRENDFDAPISLRHVPTHIAAEPGNAFNQVTRHVEIELVSLRINSGRNKRLIRHHAG